MRSKIKVLFSFILVLSFGCVMDHFEHFFKVRNALENDVRVYFSKKQNIDTVTFSKSYTIIKSGEIYSPHTQDLFDKEQYARQPQEKLYMFVFNESIIGRMSKSGDYDLTDIAGKSFLERKQIDIFHITKMDTILISSDKR